MEWLDAHSGSVQALATLVLVAITAYYAWVSRALVKETHTTLAATARMTLQERLNRVSELFVQQPDLWKGLDDPSGMEQRDARFHAANMLVAVFEEAFTQYSSDRAMHDEDWQAWVATMDRLMNRRYLTSYWREVRDTYGQSFRDFLDSRLG